jgi:hypothetical protein
MVLAIAAHPQILTLLGSAGAAAAATAKLAA